MYQESVTLAVDGAMLAYRIKGTSAVLNGFSGDATPYRVLVDSEDYSAFTTPTMTTGRMTLFTGLADDWHNVLIWQDNSSTGQGFVAPSGTLIEADEILPMGHAFDVCDPLFPGVATSPRIDSIYYPQFTKRVIGRGTSLGYGTANPSIHFRAKFTSLWVLALNNPTHASISIGGALATTETLSTFGPYAGGAAGAWRKINVAAQTSLTDIIITGTGTTSGGVYNGATIVGVMAVGDGAFIASPSNSSKRHVTMFGASQVQGINTGAGGFVNDMALVQNRLPIFGGSWGLAGASIDALNTALPAMAAKLAVKDKCMFSIGINSADDAAFQPSYTALIQTALDNGFAEVICRGLVTVGSNASKNAKIAAAVASFSSANVVYADVSTWTATTDGSGGSIAMPDTAHPSAAGFATMADFWVRDHASLFT